MMKEVDVYVLERKDNFCKLIQLYFDRHSRNSMNNSDSSFANEALFILKSIK